MKNVVLKVALGLSLASAAALAQGAFIGIEGDYSFNSKLTAKSDNDTTKVKKAQPGIGLKAGYEFMALTFTTFKQRSHLVMKTVQ